MCLRFVHDSQCLISHKLVEILRGQGCRHNLVSIRKSNAWQYQIPQSLSPCASHNADSPPQILKKSVVAFVLFVLSHRNNTPALHFVSTCSPFSRGSSSLLSSHWGQQCSSFNSLKGLSTPSFSSSSTEHQNAHPESRAKSTEAITISAKRLLISLESQAASRAYLFLRVRIHCSECYLILISSFNTSRCR